MGKHKPLSQLTSDIGNYRHLKHFLEPLLNAKDNNKESIKYMRYDGHHDGHILERHQ